MTDKTAYDDAARARWVPEPPKRADRSPFERDRARVLHSAGLRRLAAKTQVHVPGYDDFVRNRLTHTLEVAQIGRELGKALGCDPDIVETACLAHDLGHPPFGHNGEAALAALAVGIGGFEGNAQTLRLLTRLEAKTEGAGLNLTRASLDAATKYPHPRQPAASADPAIPPKFGVYDDDWDVFAWMRQGVEGRRRCIEAQIMDFADDVAYSVHDLEDGVQSGAVVLSRLPAASERAAVLALTADWYLPDSDPTELASALGRLLEHPSWPRGHDGTRPALAALKNMTSQLIGRFCAAAQVATRSAYGGGPLTRYAADLAVPRATAAEVAVLKGIAARFIMTADERQPLLERQRQTLHELADALAGRAPDALEPAFAVDWKTAPDDGARLRVIVDQIASLTDSSAVAWHATLVRAGP